MTTPGGRALLVAVVLLSIALAPSVPAFAQEPARGLAADLTGRPVVSVELRGLVELPPAALASRIATRAGSAFDPEVLSADIVRLHATGEVDPAVGIRAEVRPAGGGVAIVFHLAERPRIESIRVVSLEGDGLDPDELRAAVTHPESAPLDRVAATADAETLRALVVRAGFPRAEVAWQADADLVFAIDPGERRFVDAIELDGAAAFDPAELESVIATREAFAFGWIIEGRLDEDELARDADRIAAHYRDRGWLDVVVTTEPARPDDRVDGDGGATVRFRIEEGDRYTVGSVKVAGASAIPAKELAAALGVAAGEAWDVARVDAGLEAIARRYGALGHVLARPRLLRRVDPEARTIALTLLVDEGPAIRIGRVIIEGNDETRDSVIRRRLRVAPGETADLRAIEASVAALRSRGWFERVSVRLRQGEGDAATRDLIVRVVEADTSDGRIGVGISSDTNVFGELFYHQRNFDITRLPRSWSDIVEGRAFKGGGQRLLVQLQPGDTRSSYRVRFTEPALFGSRLIFSTDAFWHDHDLGELRQTRRGGRISLGRELFAGLVAKLTYRLEDVRVHDIEQGSSADVLAAAGRSTISSFGVSLSIDRTETDARFLRHDGWSASVSWEIGAAALGSDLDFHRIRAQASWQTTLFELPDGLRHVLAVRAEMGLIDELSGTDDIPISERFFAGGASSLRGFDFRGVGPRENGDAIGGDFLLAGSLEYSFPLSPGGWVRGVAFLDAGSVVPEVTDFLLTDRADDRNGLRVSAGVGLRIVIPWLEVPLALDFGVPIVKMDGDDEERFSFTIGIGFSR